MQCMISKSKFKSDVAWMVELPLQHNAFVLIFFKTMYSKTIIITFGFCDIRNNQGLSMCYQLEPKVEADNTYLDHNYSGNHKNLIQ